MRGTWTSKAFPGTFSFRRGGGIGPQGDTARAGRDAGCCARGDEGMGEGTGGLVVIRGWSGWVGLLEPLSPHPTTGGLKKGVHAGFKKGGSVAHKKRGSRTMLNVAVYLALRSHRHPPPGFVENGPGGWGEVRGICGQAAAGRGRGQSTGRKRSNTTYSRAALENEVLGVLGGSGRGSLFP